MTDLGSEWGEDDVVELRASTRPLDDGWGDDLPDGAGSSPVDSARSEVADAVDGWDTPVFEDLVAEADDLVVPIDWQDVDVRSDVDSIRLADDRPYVQAIPNDPERFQVVTHGSAEGLQADVLGERIDLDVQQTAALIEANDGWQGRPVTLFGCSSGAGDFAQELADRLGVDVTAPTDVVQVLADGSTVVGSFVHPGEWVTFHPKEAPGR